MNAEPANTGGADGQLVELVYDQLRRIAQQRLGEERTGHTLQATALVHEAFLRLSENRQTPWTGRAHYYAAAAEAMRRILIDHARSRKTERRGGGKKPLPLSVVDLAEHHDSEQVLALDEAISRFEREEPRAAEVVRLRFFAGLTVDETAEAMGQSRRTVLRDWEYARAWLKDALESGL